MYPNIKNLETQHFQEEEEFIKKEKVEYPLNNERDQIYERVVNFESINEDKKKIPKASN